MMRLCYGIPTVNDGASTLSQTPFGDLSLLANDMLAEDHSLFSLVINAVDEVSLVKKADDWF